MQPLAPAAVIASSHPLGSTVAALIFTLSAVRRLPQHMKPPTN
jgi:hypothetical protein